MSEDNSRKRPKWTYKSIAISCICVVLIVLTVMEEAYRGSTRNGELPCIHSLYFITRATDEYRKKHGTLPPAYTVAKNDLPAHSWRVAILPFLGDGFPEFLAQYRYDE